MCVCVNGEGGRRVKNVPWCGCVWGGGEVAGCKMLQAPLLTHIEKNKTKLTSNKHRGIVILVGGNLEPKKKKKWVVKIGLEK